jgi:hypothetical protein
VSVAARSTRLLRQDCFMFVSKPSPDDGWDRNSLMLFSGAEANVSLQYIWVARSFALTRVQLRGE